MKKNLFFHFCHMADYLFFLRNFQKLQQIILTLNLGYHGGVGERGSVEDINRRIDVHSRFGRVFQYSLQLLESSCIHIAFQGICQLLQCFFSLFIFVYEEILETECLKTGESTTDPMGGSEPDKDELLQEDTIGILKTALQKAIEEEDYERAAQIRDQINQLKNNL